MKVKGDGAFIDGSCHASNDLAAVADHGFKDSLVELVSQPSFAKVRMDANKVNVPLVRIGLRNQANHEADDETILFCHKAGWAKMDEKQLGKHLCHPPSTPPVVNGSDDHLVVIGFGMADHGIVQFDFPRLEKLPTSHVGWCESIADSPA